MFSFQATGVDAVIKLLQDTRGKKANAGIRKGSRAGCKIIAKQAANDIPVVDRKSRSGEVQRGLMRKSVKVRALKRNNKGWVGCAVAVGPANYQGEDFYAPMVEYGTKKMQARHYLEKAADKTEARASAVAIDVIVRELTK